MQLKKMNDRSNNERCKKLKLNSIYENQYPFLEFSFYYCKVRQHTPFSIQFWHVVYKKTNQIQISVKPNEKLML